MGEILFDFIEAENATVLGNVERAVPYGDAVGRVQPGSDCINGVGLAVLVGVNNGIHSIPAAVADKNRSLRTERHGTRIRDLGKDGNMKPGWELYVVDRNLSGIAPGT